jgi:hypothetical protein
LGESISISSESYDAYTVSGEKRKANINKSPGQYFCSCMCWDTDHWFPRPDLIGCEKK